MPSIITSEFYGKYGVDPHEIPLCPICDQPITVGELIELQTCDVGPHMPDLVRLVHKTCADDED